MVRSPKGPRFEGVERTIQFFRADAGRDSDTALPLPFDYANSLNVVRSLQFGEVGRGGYLREPDGDDICVVADDVRPDALRVGRVRRSAFPMPETAGKVTPLQLEAQYGLFESIHVVFFPNNIVGADYNHFGPRISKLAAFLTERCRASVVFHPLLGRDAANQLERMKSISAAELKIRANYVAEVQEADRNLGNAFASMRSLVADEGATLEIVMTPSNTGRFEFADHVKGALVRLARRDDIIHGATKFQVQGATEDRESLAVNVLKDHLVTRKQIVKMNSTSRALHDASAYEAISEAYREREGELVRAAVVVLQ